MRSYPLWKTVVVFSLAVLGVLAALPSFLGDDPALEIARVDGRPISDLTGATMEAVLKAAGIDYSVAHVGRDALLLGVRDSAARDRAAKLLRESLDFHRVALAFAPRTPAWLTRLGLRPLRPGLELGRRIELLYEGDAEPALQRYRERLVSQLGAEFEQRRPAATVRLAGDVIEVHVAPAEDKSSAGKVIEDFFDSVAPLPELATDGPTISQIATGDGLRYEIRPSERDIERRRDAAIQQNINMIRSSMPAFGVPEFSIEHQGLNGIRIRFSNARAPSALQQFIETHAHVEFRLADTGGDAVRAQRSGNVPPGSMLLEQEDGTPILLHAGVVARGDELTEVRPGRFPMGTGVELRFNDLAASRLLAATKTHRDRPVATLRIEERPEIVRRGAEHVLRTVRDYRVIDVAIVHEPVSSPLWITGLEPSEAEELALLLRGGAFAAPMTKINERMVGPGVGRQKIMAGITAVAAVFSLLVVFMVARYRALGVAAGVALLVNLALIVGALSLLRVPLTLWSIGAVVVSAGLVVAACLRIIGRIRRELANGNSPQASIRTGYRRAFGSIVALSITILAGSLVLLLTDVTAVQGFAVALSIGSLTAVFTSVAVTRATVNLIESLRQYARTRSMGRASEF